MRSTTDSSLADAGVTVVVPVLNGAGWLPDVLAAIVSECGPHPHEILVVDDGSRDGSADVARRTGGPRLRVIGGPGCGAAAAVNAGLRAARFPLVAQIDQDVIVQRGWLAALAGALRDPDIAAAQGWYIADRRAPAIARVMALDLEQRYARIAAGRTDHVCTGNVLWRRDAVLRAGGLDESLGYGYDNDLSYRLAAAGHRLVICAEARAVHRWREGWRGYLSQQYGFGYGRLDLVARHRRRVTGDRVSPLPMMAHPAVMTGALGAGTIALLSAAITGSAGWWPAVAGALAGALALERTAAGVAASLRWRDPAALLFPVAHLVRDLAWVAAIGRWTTRRLAGTPLAPAHSMAPRLPSSPAVPTPAPEPR
jgi:hypothetical protein